MRRISIVISVVLLVSSSVFAQTRIALVPIQAIGIEETDRATAESLFKIELRRNLSNQNAILIPVEQDNSCFDVGCAVQIGKRESADEVIICQLSRLGEKIIVQYMLLNVRTGNILISDNAISLSIEEVDTVLKRIAISLLERKEIGKTAKVGNIIESETRESMRRTTNKTTGFSFGYVYPMYGYDNNDRIFALDFRTGFESEQWAVGMLHAIRSGYATNVYAHYLTTRTDFCPYFGGAFGFHWVSHDRYYESYYDEQQWVDEEEKSNDGFELTLTGGVRLFRTYNFQVMGNFDFILTLNDYDDKAFVFTIGLLK